MASADDYAAWIVKNADKKGTPEFDTVASAYHDAKKSGSNASHIAIQNKIDGDPISQGAMGFAQDMPWYQKLVAGYGKAVPDMVRGVGQRLGMVDQSTVDEAKRLDAPLMRTGLGVAGNVLGNVSAGTAAVAAAAPVATAMGAGAMPTAIATGMGLGAAQPTASGESVPQNIALGGLFGGGSVLAGQLMGAGYRGLKAIAEPFTAAGPQRIAGRTIQRFAEDPSRISNVSNAPTATGALPTLAEQTGDRGIAHLQDSLRSVDPQIANALAGRFAENNASRVNALSGLAGDSTQRTAAEAAREAAASPLYAVAKAKAMEVDPQLAELLKRPSVQSALTRAAAYAKEQGRTFGLTASKDVPASAVLDASGAPMAAGYTIPGKVTGQTMHDLKMGMDALLKDPTSGIAGAEAGAVKDTRKLILTWLENKAPEYGQARTTYAATSKPINGMDVGEEILRRATSNTSDLAGNPRMQANALLGMLRDEPALIERATGRKGINALSDVFEPKDLNMLRQVASETDRSAAVQSAGMGPGSATAQRLASQNILRQVITPNGSSASPGLGQKIGQAVVDNTLANTVVGKATNWIYSGIAEPKIQQALLKAVLQPEEAKAAIQAAQQQGVKLPSNLMLRLADQARRVTGISSSQATRQP